MKDTFSAIFLQILIYLCFLLPESALSQATPSVASSVVLISSRTESGCATGFLMADGTLITNAHVTNSLCPFGDCRNLVLRTANLPGESALSEIPVQSVKLRTEVGSLDFAVLEIISNQKTTGLFNFPRGPVTAVPLLSAGFPLCKSLELVSGQTTELNEIYLKTTLPGKHGVSGSPIYTQDFEVVGVVNQASSLIEALGSLGFGLEFEASGIRADLVRDVSRAPDKESLLLEAQALNNYYLRDIAKLRGTDRLRAALPFLDAAHRLKQRLASLNFFADFGLPLSFLGQYLAEVPLPKNGKVNDPLYLELELLALTHNLEYKGPFRSVLKPMEISTLLNALKDAGRSEQHVQKVTAVIESFLFNNRGYFGTEWYLLWLVSVVVLAAIVLCLLMAWTLGYVHVATQGGFFMKIWNQFWVGALFWPVSFVAFWLFHLGKKRR